MSITDRISNKKIQPPPDRGAQMDIVGVMPHAGGRWCQRLSGYCNVPRDHDKFFCRSHNALIAIKETAR